MYSYRTRRITLVLIAIAAGISGCQDAAHDAATGPQVLGSITAIIHGDGNDDNDRPTKWQINGVAQGGNIQSRSQWQGPSKNGSVILLGELPGVENTASSVAIRFDYDPDLGKQYSARIRYYVDGIDRPSFASKGEGIAIVYLDSVNFNRGQAHLKGSFRAVLPFRRKGKSVVDCTRELSDGTFDVVVPMVDDPRPPRVAAINR